MKLQSFKGINNFELVGKKAAWFDFMREYITEDDENVFVIVEIGYVKETDNYAAVLMIYLGDEDEYEDFDFEEDFVTIDSKSFSSFEEAKDKALWYMKNIEEYESAIKTVIG